MKKDKFNSNDLYSRIYIDAHLCKPQCSDLQIINYKSGKGVVYLAMFRVLGLLQYLYKIMDITLLQMKFVIIVEKE